MSAMKQQQKINKRGGEGREGDSGTTVESKCDNFINILFITFV